VRLRALLKLPPALALQLLNEDLQDVCGCIFNLGLIHLFNDAFSLPSLSHPWKKLNVSIYQADD